MKLDLEDETIMRELTRMSLEAATQSLAKKAREFAKTLPPEIPGSAALEAFANAIESTNSKVWHGKPSD